MNQETQEIRERLAELAELWSAKAENDCVYESFVVEEALCRIKGGIPLAQTDGTEETLTPFAGYDGGAEDWIREYVSSSLEQRLKEEAEILSEWRDYQKRRKELDEMCGVGGYSPVIPEDDDSFRKRIEYECAMEDFAKKAAQPEKEKKCELLRDQIAFLKESSAYSEESAAKTIQTACERLGIDKLPDTTNERCAVLKTAREVIYDKLTGIWDAMNGKLDFLPEKLRDPESVKGLLDIFDYGRADSLKEAMQILYTDRKNSEKSQ